VGLGLLFLGREGVSFAMLRGMAPPDEDEDDTAPGTERDAVAGGTRRGGQ
jgi:hypothetical protein